MLLSEMCFVWKINHFPKNKEEKGERVKGCAGAVRLLWLHSSCKGPVAMEIEYEGTLVARGPHSHKSLLLNNNDCSGRERSYFSLSCQHEISQSAKPNVQVKVRGNAQRRHWNTLGRNSFIVWDEQFLLKKHRILPSSSIKIVFVNLHSSKMQCHVC